MPEAFYLVLTIMIFVLGMGILCLIFLPKVMMHKIYAGMTPEEQNQRVTQILRESSHRMRVSAQRQNSQRRSGSQNFSESASYRDAFNGISEPLSEPSGGSERKVEITEDKKAGLSHISEISEFENKSPPNVNESKA